MFVVEYYRRHEGLIAYVVVDGSIETARTKMRTWIHELRHNDFWREGGIVQLMSEDRAVIMVDHSTCDINPVCRCRTVVSKKKTSFRYLHDYYTEVRIVVATSGTEQWPSYRKA